MTHDVFLNNAMASQNIYFCYYKNKKQIIYFGRK